MKNVLLAAIAAIVCVAVSATDVQAQAYQHFQNGYGFGAGVHQTNRGNGFLGNGFRGNGFNGRRSGFGLGLGFGAGYVDRPVTPPYFAMFPPVYYSGIVRRPYGISPYAAPAGIPPVELQIQQTVAPVTVKNPFFNDVTPVSDIEDKADAEAENKTTWIANPHLKGQEMTGEVFVASAQSVLE